MPNRIHTKKYIQKPDPTIVGLISRVIMNIGLN